MLIARSDTELVESTADATPDDVDIGSVTVARSRQSVTQRALPTLVSQRRMAPMPPRRYGAQRHVASRLLHHCLPSTLTNCTSH